MDSCCSIIAFTVVILFIFKNAMSSKLYMVFKYAW